MATTVSINSTYAGEVAGEIIGKAFKEADTISKGLITVLPNIAFKHTVRKLRYADGRVDYSCGFAPAGSVTLTERVLEPKKIKNELEVCKEDFRQVWDSASMGFSAHNDNLPKDEAEALLVEILGDTAEATERDIWQGDSVNTGEFDGYLKLFIADASVNKVTGTTVTASNVLAELDKIYDAIPDALLHKDLVWAVPYSIEKFYKQAIGAGDYLNQGVVGDKPINFLGNDLMPVSGMPADTVIVYDKKNLFFGTGLMSDHNDIRIKDMDEVDLTGQVRYKMVYTAGVQYANSEDVTTYGVA